MYSHFNINNYSIEIQKIFLSTHIFSFLHYKYANKCFFLFFWTCECKEEVMVTCNKYLLFFCFNFLHHEHNQRQQQLFIRQLYANRNKNFLVISFLIHYFLDFVGGPIVGGGHCLIIMNTCVKVEFTFAQKTVNKLAKNKKLR